MVSLRGMARSIRGRFAGGRQEPTVESPDSDLDNRPWLSLVAECVGLYDELDRTRASFDPPRRAVAEHVCLRLEEILDRAGVERVEGAGLTTLATAMRSIPAKTREKLLDSEDFFLQLEPADCPVGIDELSAADG